MQLLDYLVLIAYFLVVAGIGLLCMRTIKVQEDYFMGGRRFGKLLQTFAAFGAGTGSADPVNTGRTSWTSGFSGMWSVMYWLFVTPFYWITAVWYRRMRHLTLGDWYVERYESKAMGAAYTVYGLTFFMIYGSMMFSAIGKVAAPLVGVNTIGQTGIGIEYLLVPIIGVAVLIYGIAGGLKAAYWTDLLQGIGIIVLSIILIPAGLDALVKEFGDPQTQTTMDGFRIMHERLPAEQFELFGTSASEFPWYRILAVVLINLVGIVVQPHFIATGGGSAKTEASARIGLVTGNFLKRFCTIGWALTALICLALFAGNPELSKDPDKVWGVASRELLAPGLSGLMLACLLAALMSSIDAYMVVGSALVVRNIYAPFINPNATEKEYINTGRLTGLIVVGGAVIISLFMMDVFKQLQLTWVFGVTFAAPFWIGMYWRRATKWASWATVLYCVAMFFAIPMLWPVFQPKLRSDPAYLGTNEMALVIHQRIAAPTDVATRQAAIKHWEDEHQNLEAANDMEGIARLGPKPTELRVGKQFAEEPSFRGGKSIFWSGGVKPVNENGQELKNVKPQPVGEPNTIDEHTTETILAYDPDVKLKGFGDFNLDRIAYQFLGIDLNTKSNAMLDTLELPPKIVTPFLVMILLSLVTPRNRKKTLDRYYTKMKVKVLADPVADLKQLEAAYENPHQFENRKLFPNSSLEIQKPSFSDVAGFVICFGICFLIIYLAIWIAGIGGG